jgi:hypothetical protein
MQQAATARVLLRRLHPWLGRAVHVRWKIRRSIYQSEADALLLALAAHQGRLPPELGLRVETFVTRLHREWFPRNWRRNPTYAEIVADFRWWLLLAERWAEPPARPVRRGRAAAEPPADQPKRLLRMLGLKPETTASQFAAAWRRFLKRNHPDLNPDQTEDERRRFAEAVGLWKR